MSILARQPTTRNFLSPLGFVFNIAKLPNMNYFVQEVNLPTVNLGETEGLPTPLQKVPVPGDHLTFGELNVTFRVSEDMSNYIEVYNWITAVGFPDNFDQYANLKAQEIPGTGEGIFSDASLILLTSAHNPSIQITFEQLYPVSLSDLQFTTTATTIEYLECTAGFVYRKFNIETI